MIVILKEGDKLYAKIRIMGKNGVNFGEFYGTYIKMNGKKYVVERHDGVMQEFSEDGINKHFYTK